jgi:D-alanyl-D-alanine carboxypeptidase
MPYLKNPQISPIVSAGGVYIMDLDCATPIFERRANDRFLPASTTKIITALTALDTFGLNDSLEVKRASPEGQVVGILPGDKLHFEHVLYGILVHSGNDTAYMIADNFPGGENAFVTAMNKKTQELGMKNSMFKNPAGLDSPGQYTTPFDLALAARKLLQNEELSRIVSTKSITISDTEFKHFYKLSNVNKLLGEIEGIGGLKTGYTEEAGENLVTFYKHGNHQFLIVILKSEDRFADTTAVVDWIKGNVDYVDL